MRKPKQKSALQAIEEALEILRPASTLEGKAKESVEVLLDLSGRPKPAIDGHLKTGQKRYSPGH
jgi:hypothetical protein